MKKYLLPSVAVTLAIGFTSLTTINAKTHQIDEYEFIYLGGTQSPADRSNPSNYVYDDITQTCRGGQNECAVIIQAIIPPPYPSTLNSQPFGSVTFNSKTGMPNGGNEFVTNLTKL